MILVRKSHAQKNLSKSQLLEGTKDLVQYIQSITLFHQSRLSSDIELQNTHIVLFICPRYDLQIKTPSQQLGLRPQIKNWYKKFTSITCGHLLNDLTPETVDSLRFCTNSGSIPTNVFPELQENFPKKIVQKISFSF